MSKLTDREVQIAQMLADGLNGTLIAQELGISKRTVAVHMASIRTKAGFETSSGAIAWCLRHSFIE